MKFRESKTFKVLLIITLIVVITTLLFTPEPIEPHTAYKCDVKNLRLSTDIVISSDGERIGKVTGSIFRIVEEPLTMKDTSGNKIAYAGDDYHFIAQDSHVIISDGVVTAEMVGRFKLFGEKYDIYNSAGEKVATVKFNWTDTYGEMYDTKGNLVADYESFIFFNDFKLRISDDCPLDETTAIMIFCSYYSDQSYDGS